MFLSSLVSTTPLSCISMNNQVCKVRPEIINVNSNELVFYHFSIKTSKYSGSCNNINDPYAKMCVPEVVKDLNVKVFNLMSRTNETRHIKWYEMCRCECRLDGSVCNNKQRWNDDKCPCECKELIDGEYLDYENCKCRKRLVDKLKEECTENIDEARLAGIALFEHGNERVCSYTIWIVLASLTGSTGIGAYFTYKHINRNKENVSKYDYIFQAKNY